MLSQSQVLRSTQLATQLQDGKASQRSSVLGLVTELIDLAKKISQNPHDERLKHKIRLGMGKLADSPSKLTRIHAIFRVNPLDDAGELFLRFTEAWHASAELVSTDVAVKLYTQQINELLISLENPSISSTYALPALTIAAKSLRVLPQGSLAEIYAVCDDLFGRDKALPKPVVDLIQLVLGFIHSSEDKFQLDTTRLPGREFCRASLRKWLKTRTFALFETITTLCKMLDEENLLLTFWNEDVAPLLARRIKEKAQALSNEEEMIAATWKTLLVTQLVTDNKIIQSMLTATMKAWPLGEERNNSLTECFSCFASAMNSHPDLSKVVQSLYKTDAVIVINSELGFGLMLQMCGSERTKDTTVSLMKKTMAKAFKFKDEAQEIGFLCSVGAEITLSIKKQFAFFIERIKEQDMWQLFAPGFIALSYAMLECSSMKKLRICDGRAAVVPEVWLMSSCALTECLKHADASLSVYLPTLISSVVKHSMGPASGASVVLIDVVIEIVHNCIVSILNNYKCLEGIFSWICRVRRDKAIALVRCLLPVINQRTQLRRGLFTALKKELLNPLGVASAVPLLLLLFQSITTKIAIKASQTHLSQSFSTFSSQVFDMAGLSRTIDETLGLEITGVLRRCLTQSADTRAAFYKGLIDVISHNAQLVGQSLDLLFAQAKNCPEWTPEAIILSTANASSFREPVPHLIQALDCLSAVYAASMQSGMSQSGTSGECLTEKVEKLLAEWVARALEQDVHDMGIDKVSEWNPMNAEGRTNLLFAHLMFNVYSALLQVLWHRRNLDAENKNWDSLVGIFRRRKELLAILDEKTVRQKEAKATAPAATQRNERKAQAVELNYSVVEIDVSGKTISSVLDELLADTNEEQTQRLGDIRESLLEWVLASAERLTAKLANGDVLCHHAAFRRAELKNVAVRLLQFYEADDENVPVWIRELKPHSRLRTMAIKVYANIIRYSLLKHRERIMEEVVPIWKDDKAGAGPGGALMRHGARLLKQTYIAVLQADNNVDAKDPDRKKGGDQLEKQAKAIIQLCGDLLDTALITTPKAPCVIVRTLWAVLQCQEFASVAVLRDCFSLFSRAALQLTEEQARHGFCNRINSIIKTVGNTLDNEEPEAALECCTRSTVVALIDGVLVFAEKILKGIKALIEYTSDFVPKDEWDSHFGLAVAELQKVVEICTFLVTLYIDQRLFKEKVATFFTTFFATLDFSCKLLLDNAKSYGTKIKKWKSVETFTTLLKKQLHKLLIECDENIGDVDVDSSTTPFAMAKKRRNETLFVKYTHAREAFQATVLLISKALDDERFNLQVKKNAIGIRGFRMLPKKLAEIASRQAERQENDDATDQSLSTTQPPETTPNTAKRGRKKRADTSTGASPAKRGRRKNVPND